MYDARLFKEIDIRERLVGTINYDSRGCLLFAVLGINHPSNNPQDYKDHTDRKKEYCYKG
ncbi:MAG: hypothetical protein AMXMBFR17_30930 [Candidatus Jettenia caeni]|nr:MAG: hypothetical protein JETCAE04_32750 [Candidatus Jettenia caeni]